MNLLWDNEAENKQGYLRFLSSVCTVQDRGISINQENIYKLFKKYSAVKKVIDYDQFFGREKLKIPPEGFTE